MGYDMHSYGSDRTETYSGDRAWTPERGQAQSAQMTAERLIHDFVARNSSGPHNLQGMDNVDYWKRKAFIQGLDSPNDLTRLQSAIRAQEDQWKRPAPSAPAPQKQAASTAAQSAAQASVATETASSLEKPFISSWGGTSGDKSEWTSADGVGEGGSYLDNFLEKNKKYLEPRERDAEATVKSGDVTGDPEKEKSPGKILNDWGLSSLMDPFKRKKERQARMAGSGDFLAALQDSTQTSFNSSFG
jgi:hypothetical protein